MSWLEWTTLFVGVFAAGWVIGYQLEALNSERLETKLQIERHKRETYQYLWESLPGNAKAKPPAQPPRPYLPAPGLKRSGSRGEP